MSQKLLWPESSSLAHIPLGFDPWHCIWSRRYCQQVIPEHRVSTKLWLLGVVQKPKDDDDVHGYGGDEVICKTVPLGKIAGFSCLEFPQGDQSWE